MKEKYTLKDLGIDLLVTLLGLVVYFIVGVLLYFIGLSGGYISMIIGMLVWCSVFVWTLKNVRRKFSAMYTGILLGAISMNWFLIGLGIFMAYLDKIVKSNSPGKKSK